MGKKSGGGKGRKRGPKRNSHQIAADKLAASEMRKDGKSLRQIAEDRGLSYEQVRLDLKTLDKVFVESAEQNTEIYRQSVLKKVKYGQMLALNMIVMSEESGITTTEMTYPNGGVMKIKTPYRGKPNDKALEKFLKAVDMEAKLYGLYETGGGDGDGAADMLSEIFEQIKASKPTSLGPSVPNSGDDS